MPTRRVFRRSRAILLVLSFRAAECNAGLRIAVFGGSGYIGSHVCKELRALGCSVASISRTGASPVRERFKGGAGWIDSVDWMVADATEQGAALACLSGGVDGVVSCVGTSNVLAISNRGWKGNEYSAESQRFYTTNPPAW